MNKTHKETVLIMGGGLAGLSAGYELVKANKKVIVVEKQSHVGGMAQTISLDGFKFDTGPHRWYTKNNEVNKWMLDLLGKEIIKVPRLTRIYFDGKFFYYPIKLYNALTGIGLKKAFLAVYDYIKARFGARLFSQKLLTMEDGYINQFGKTLYETFFKRYSEKLWGQDCRSISIDWVGQRTRGLNISTLLKETLFKSRKVVSLVDEFSYPKEGIGRLTEKMAAEIIKKNGLVYLKSEITTINHKNGLITSVEVKSTSGKKKLLTADYFISSIPLSELIQKLRPSSPKKQLNLSKKLRYRDEILVVLCIKKSHITPDTWIYVHPKDIPFMRVMEMDNWSDLLAPKGNTSLVFELACNEGDSLWNKTDDELILYVLKTYIDEFKLIDKADYIKGYVHRCQKEYPIYHLGYRNDIEEIKSYLKNVSNLQIVGRNGTFRYNNMDHSVEMGLYAAWNLIKGKQLYDVDSVNIEREYLEEKKIENVEDEKLEEAVSEKQE